MKFENKSLIISLGIYGDKFQIDSLSSLVKTYEYCKYAKKNDTVLSIFRSSNVYGLRNNQFKEFMEMRPENPFRSLCIIDNDMIYDHRAIERLFEQDKDIIAPLMTNKKDSLVDWQRPIIPMCAKVKDGILTGIKPEEIPNEPFQVDSVGFGFVLIKRRVVEAMKWPYVQGVLTGDAAFSQNGVCGEDFYFCLEAKKKGFEIWVDPTVNIMHFGGCPYGVFNFRTNHLEEIATQYEPVSELQPT